MENLRIYHLYRSILTVSSLVIFTIFWSILAFILGIFDRRGVLVHRCAVWWSRCLFFITGVQVEVHGEKHLRDNAWYVIIVNHESALDIPALFLALRQLPLVMMAKKELFRIPLFGWVLALGGYVPIDRKNRQNAIVSLDKAAVRIPKMGMSVIVFPEGTRTVTGELKPFKKGGFVFALKSGMPLLPVTILGSRDLAPRKTKTVLPGKIQVKIDPPIYPDGNDIAMKDELLEKMYKIIQRNKRDYSNPE